jgi:hypothetical protein
VPSTTIDLSQIAAASAPNAEAGWNEPKARLDAAKWIAGVLGFVILSGLILLTIIGFRTYPTASDMKALLPGQSTGTAMFDAWKSARSDWLTSLTTLAQTFVFGSLLPILGTVVGYIVGTRSESGD